MSENLNKMVDAAQNKQASAFKSAFEDEVLNRISVAMDNKRAQVASSLFDTTDDQELGPDDTAQEVETDTDADV